MVSKKYMRSPIPYMGNKYKLLKQLIPLFPDKCDTFVDLFGGSGVVSMNYQGGGLTIYNEFNHNIVQIVKMIVDNEPKELDDYWNGIIKKYNLPTNSVKIDYMVDDRILCYTDRQLVYNKFRDDYNENNENNYKDLFLLCCYSINHLIRFNKDDQFNASSGTSIYNEKNFECVCDMHNSFKGVKILETDALCETTKHLLTSLGKDDFVYCDCPYTNTEAVYNEKRAFGGWTIESDYKLFKLLEELNECGIKWGLSNVFYNRGKENTHLIEWCDKNKWKVYHLDRNYNPFNRGNSDNDEVYICNYEKEQIGIKVELW